MTSLATLGEGAKIWEVPTFKELEQFNPYQASISDLTWSHDGHAIACCCSTDTTVHLRNTQDVLSAPSQSFQLPSECLSLDFNSDSKSLLCGCADGSLHVYNQKYKSISKSFKNQTSGISAVRWNWNNKCIAAGTSKGEIVLYNIVTSQASSPLVGRSTQAIQQLKYNPYKKAVLVSTSDDGAVNLWDTNTRRLIRNFDKSHHASAKDVAFSPINDIFMVSVGLDKKAIFYDIESKTSIKTFVADHPLTCVDVLHDGATVAIGTMRGQVFLYDMRKSSTPVFSFPAHRSSVKRLSFVRKVQSSATSNSTHPTSDSLRRQLPMSPGDPNLFNGSSVYSPRDRFSKSDVDVISPLARGNKSNNSIPDNQWTEKSADSVKFDAVGLDNAGGTCFEIFSPVRSDLSLSMDSTGAGLASSFLSKLLGENVPSRETSTSHHSLHKPDGLRAEEKGGDGLRSTPRQHEFIHGSLISASSPRTSAAQRQHQHGQHSVTFDDKPSQVLNRSDRTATTSSPSGQHSPQSRSYESAAKHMSPRISGSKPRSPLRTLQPQESPRAENPVTSLSLQAAVASSSSPPHTTTTPIVPLAGAEAAASSLNSSVTSSLRSFIQDLLHEQLQAHQASLQAEIRDMVSGSGVRQGQVSSTQGSKSTKDMFGSESTHQNSHPNPEVYQAEFIRSIVKDEWYNIQDWMSNWFWAIKRDQIKTTMQLERMEALLADSCVNPLLLEEIERLKEENARLKSTF